MSATEAPLHHLPSPVTCASSVTSSNLKSPLLRYNLLLTSLAVKYKSCKPSLLKSPTATPPPLYKNSRSIGFTESFSVIWLLNSIPVCDDDCFRKRVSGWLHENRTMVKKNIRSLFILEMRN